jgi:hypothetical protein
MTRDEFSAKYKLLKQIDGGDGRSYTAEHRPTGRAVMVHFLPGDSTSAAELPGLIARLGPRDGAKITDTLSVDDSVVVVSEFIETSGSFAQWLRGRAGHPTPPASASSVIPSSASPPREGEFTHLFRHSDDEPMPGPGAGTSQPRLESPAPSPGSFTELFQPLAESGMAAAPPPPQAAGPSVPVRSVRVPTPATPERATVAPPISGSPIPAALGPGESRDPPPVPVLRPADVPSPAIVPGPPLLSSLAGIPPAGPREPNRGFVLPTMAAPGPPAAPAPPPAFRQGPSDYTRILGGASDFRDAPPVLQAASPPASSPGPPAKSFWPLWLLLNVVLILATGLVVYFALKHC